MDKVKHEFRKIQVIICSIFMSRITKMKRQNNISAILIVRLPVYDIAGTVERKKIVRSEKGVSLRRFVVPRPIELKPRLKSVQTNDLGSNPRQSAQ